MALEPRSFLDGAAEIRLEVADRGLVHPRDLHVAPERDRPDPVLDSVPDALHERRREEHVEPARAHPDRERDEEVAELVDEDQEREPDDRDGDIHRTSSVVRAAATRRASASTVTRSSRSR